MINSKKSSSASSDDFTSQLARQTKKALEDEDYLEKLSKKWRKTAEDKVISHISSQLGVNKNDFEAALRGDAGYLYKSYSGRDMPNDHVEMLEQGYELLRKKESTAFNSTEKHFFAFLRFGQATDESTELGELLSTYAVNTGKQHAINYTVAYAEKKIDAASSKILTSSASKALAKYAPSTAIASGVVACKTAIVDYLKGDITTEELLASISHTTITTSASLYAGAIGQLALPIPLLGAFVGSSVGYFISHIMHQSSLIALGDTAAVAAAKQRRKVVEAMCMTAIPALQKHRAELEKQLDQHFFERRETFIIAFNSMDDALSQWEPDKFVSALEIVNQQYGMTLRYKSFEEFDAMMRSDDDFEF